MNIFHTSLAIIISLIIAGCSPLTLKSAKQKGDIELNARDIFNLVSGNTLTLTAYDFDGMVYFSEDGRLAGIDNEELKDSGRWDIKENNQLCIKFQTWYYGDLNCYSVVSDPGQTTLSFFTANGAAYYTGTISHGDSAALANEIKTRKSPTYLRQTLAEEKTGTTTWTMETDQQSVRQTPPPENKTNMATSSSIRQLAQKCNGCNLSGADLKEATLVKAELQGADLSHADLRYANLRRARLAGADLSGALLNHANLPGADLTDCDLRGADLSGANLLLTNFTGADLTGANLTNAHIENTIGLER